MNDDLRELFSLFKSHEVEFVVIRAHALAFHARPRMTEDIDVFVGRARENADRLASALAGFGAPIGEQGVKAFAELDRQMIRIRVPPNVVDILNFAGTKAFEEVWERRVQGMLDGLDVWFVSKEDLIDMKRAGGRPQDLIDLALLEQA